MTGHDGEDGEELLATQQNLIELERQGLLVRLGPDTWQLTPAGRARVEEMLNGGVPPGMS